MRRRHRILGSAGTLTATLVTALCAVGCAPQAWRSDQRPVSVEAIRRELGLHVPGLKTTEVPEIPAPKYLRPCCAFGSNINVSAVGVKVPAYQLANILGPEDLGEHKYDGGLPLTGDLGRDAFMTDKNGLVFTCRAGFVDTAHLSLWADFSLYLMSWVGRHLESGGTLPLKDEGGQREIVLEPIDPDLLYRYGVRQLTVPLAQWLAWKMSVWHEIATWYGWSHVPMFSELASAFSPEDFYSNLLGIKLAGVLVYERAAISEEGYNEEMTNLIRLALEELGALPAELGHAAMMYSDGVWWDSKAMLPSKALVLRRYFDVRGNRVAPWRITDIDGGAPPEVAEACGDLPRHTLWLERDFQGVALRDLAELRIRVSDALLQKGFPLPEGGRQPVTSADFIDVIEHVRGHNDEEFGEGSDRPERDPIAGPRIWEPAE